MENILQRRSIRKYTDKSVSNEEVDNLLRAAMAAPSAGNEQPWEFIVLRDKSVMEEITKIHPYAKMLLSTDVAIVVCGDISKERFKGNWVLDCSAATQNILLAAQATGLGAVWLGVYPDNERSEAVKNILNLPSNVIPLSIIPVGYPDEEKDVQDRFDKTRIHNNRW
ncbi:nitroreductase family protein [Clostridium cellulovorans]|uniref:Nitroreductase n=1 Tax=Clostridium cellulovorans (strain ATCC 35296 / DSM 3052 / OCM 3 / 743B) TaxID=573061 RepID=D9SMF3_CLOC7|nr:nitroreductase family protein [Clostridium cellulovorans]ADL53809.1 nitroreductase [Clostridium cellulovorans 743B]